MIKSEVKDDKIDLNTKMKAFYGMERQENDTNTPKNLVRDIIVCPICKIRVWLHTIKSPPENVDVVRDI